MNAASHTDTLERAPRTADHRTVLCGVCQTPALFVQDERTDRMGYTCRDQRCDGHRKLYR